MRITVEDCLKLDAFKDCYVATCRRKLNKRVRTISVFDEKDIDDGIARNGVREQMVLTHFWNIKDDVDAQCKVISGFGRKDIAALVVFYNNKGARALDHKVLKTAEDSGLLIITINDDVKTTYSILTEQVLDKILYGHNYSDNIINNSIYNLLNFEKHSNFQSALQEAAINNDYQVVLMTAEFNPILTIETRHKATVENAIKLAKGQDVSHLSSFKQIIVKDVITYWGSIEIDGVKHMLLLVDNDDNYSATEMKKLAEVIELAMGMWKYTPKRDSRAEFIKAAIRGDVAFCYTLIDEAGFRDKSFISVFYANGINNEKCESIIDKFKENTGCDILPLIEENEYYGMVYTDDSIDNWNEQKMAILSMYEELKDGRKDVRIFHSTGVEELDNAIDGFRLINDTWSYVESVFPYKRVFTKYEMSMVYNCIEIQLQNGALKKMYFDLLEPFSRELSPGKGRLLLETLETFVLDAGMNSNKTAEFMGVHNNTVQYRLKRINEILGTEMIGNRVIPGLTMALALKRLEDR